MKPYIDSIIPFCIPVLLIYLGFTFATLEPNPYNWSEYCRGTAAFCSILCGFWYAVIVNELK